MLMKSLQYMYDSILRIRVSIQATLYTCMANFFLD